jgi:hypothetical protein
MLAAHVIRALNERRRDSQAAGIAHGSRQLRACNPTHPGLQDRRLDAEPCPKSLHITGHDHCDHR